MMSLADNTELPADALYTVRLHAGQLPPLANNVSDLKQIR